MRVQHHLLIFSHPLGTGHWIGVGEEPEIVAVVSSGMWRPTAVGFHSSAVTRAPVGSMTLANGGAQPRSLSNDYHHFLCFRLRFFLVRLVPLFIRLLYLLCFKRVDDRSDVGSGEARLGSRVSLAGNLLLLEPCLRRCQWVSRSRKLPMVVGCGTGSGGERVVQGLSTSFSS
ncbi:hypothetical protein HDV57DRAFT_393519 [Trichoderma longibrachiatum]|uniref:Uncharacterized protein n=1 Tax=Trichoderma longibrachiatum ATCC 18648 TaxID=983965 RepID=A0A2T4C3F0_TRILO|nr:hypothetical protein M440DRAFT_313990 [Trichoderma longibrachiatum ATCC 18648]